jgi:hypothetical protein
MGLCPYRQRHGTEKALLGGVLGLKAVMSDQGFIHAGEKQGLAFSLRKSI